MTCFKRLDISGLYPRHETRKADSERRIAGHKALTHYRVIGLMCRLCTKSLSSSAFPASILVAKHARRMRRDGLHRIT